MEKQGVKEEGYRNRCTAYKCSSADAHTLRCGLVCKSFKTKGCGS